MFSFIEYGFQIVKKGNNTKRLAKWYWVFSLGVGTFCGGMTLFATEIRPLALW